MGGGRTVASRVGSALVLASAVVLVAALGAVAASPRTGTLPGAGEAPGHPVRFAAVRILIDAPAGLAAWQVTLEPASGAASEVRIVGVEGGGDAPWGAPPYFDPAAIRGDRLVTGAFSLRPEPELPSGRVHVATVHLELRGAGDPADAFDAVLDVASAADGRRLPARVELQPGVDP